MPLLAAEEARAAAYLAQQARRAAWQVANQARLAGNPAAAQALRDNWQPLLDYLAERDSNGGQGQAPGE